MCLDARDKMAGNQPTNGRTLTRDGNVETAKMAANMVAKMVAKMVANMVAKIFAMIAAKIVAMIAAKMVAYMAAKMATNKAPDSSLSARRTISIICWISWKSMTSHGYRTCCWRSAISS